MPPITVSVVSVSWNCRDFVLRFLQSVLSDNRRDVEVILVDNASTDGTAEAVRSRFPSVHLIANKTNIGFAAATNCGVSVSHGTYLAIVNPDVMLMSGCLTTLEAALRADDKTGMVGPAMVDQDGVVHRSGMRLPSLWHSLCDALMLHRLFPGALAFGGVLMHDFDWTRRRDLDILNGWFWLVRRDAAQQVGPLDERFFMYGEDVDWCKRFRDAGWRIVFEPEAQAIHYGGGSSRNIPLTAYLALERANRQLWQKHYGLLYRCGYSLVRLIHHGLRVVSYSFLTAVRPTDGAVRFKLRRHTVALALHLVSLRSTSAT
jgi:GT2 family glycosyltransferase